MDFNSNSDIITPIADSQDSGLDLDRLNTQEAGATITFNAADLNLNSYQIENFADARSSGGQIISLKETGSRNGRASGVFNGASGNYQVTVGYYDENDGISNAEVIVNGEASSFRFDRNLDDDRASTQTFTTRVTHDSVALANGDSFAIDATSDDGEYARFDYIEFKAIPNSNNNPTEPDPTPETPSPAPNPTPSNNDVADYPVIEEFSQAGVRGGIPKNRAVVVTINPGDNIQTAIEDASRAGGGVVLLTSGTYEVDSTINLEDNVTLRGENRDSVILESTIRSSGRKENTILFNDDSYAGIENLTIDYEVSGVEPVDRSGLEDGGFCRECFQNDPGGRDDLNVRQIHIESNSNDNWVTNVSVLNSGTDPIWVAGNHNTLRNNLVDRAYNKGSGGNGYYDLRGDYNLIQGETVKRIRHFAIQQGAEYNVVVDSNFEVDVNFHNGDGGNNLVEGNTINLPSWHGWDIFATGGAQYGHDTPGANNILFNNNTRDYGSGESPFGGDDTIYTFTGYGDPVATDWEIPTGGTFYQR